MLRDIARIAASAIIESKRRMKKMTNRDKINALSNIELAGFFGKNGMKCSLCVYRRKRCFDKNCAEGIKAWLDAPSNKSSRKRLAVKPENPPAIKDDLAKVVAGDLAEMFEDMITKKHKTVPRQKPDADSKKDIESLKELFKGAVIMNPIDWEILDIPALGAKTYMVVFNDVNELVILENKFMVSDIELWMLAQGRLFTDRWSAEMYLKKCTGVVSAMKAQLQVLTKEDSL